MNLNRSSLLSILGAIKFQTGTFSVSPGIFSQPEAFRVRSCRKMLYSIIELSQNVVKFSSEAASTLAGTANSQIDAEAPTTSGKRSPTKKSTGKDKGSDVRSKSPRRYANCGLPFAVVKSNDPKTIAALEMNAANQRRLEAKRRFRYCYECGRLIGKYRDLQSAFVNCFQQKLVSVTALR